MLFWSAVAKRITPRRSSLVSRASLIDTADQRPLRSRGSLRRGLLPLRWRYYAPCMMQLMVWRAERRLRRQLRPRLFLGDSRAPGRL